MRYFKVCKRTVQRMPIPYAKIGGRRVYLPKDLDLYERHDWERFWLEDGEKLRTYWGDKLPAAHLRLA